MRVESRVAMSAVVLGLAASFLLAGSAQAAPGASGYHVVKTVPIGGDGRWDYCIVDSAARRVYVSHGTHVVVLDAESKRVFAFNGRSANAIAVNAADGKVAGMIPVGGKPEFAAGDDQGHVFVNIEDKSQLLEIDAEKLSVLHRWPLAGCKEPSGLAFDQKNRRLFSVCGNKKMMVVNADTGAVVATVAIGEDPDAAGFDPDTQLVFSSNGESGDLSVIHQDSADKYTVLENVPTRKYARTMAVDFSTHSIFLPFAEFEPVTPKGQEELPMKPNSFGVLSVGR